MPVNNIYNNKDNNELMNKDWITFSTIILLSVFLTLLAMMPIGYMVYRNYPPQIYTVDLQRILENNTQSKTDLLGQTVLKDQKRQWSNTTDAAKFAQRLSNVIDALSKDCRCIIINKAALLGGDAIDLTDQIVAKLK